jgi:hypothetical protein
LNDERFTVAHTKDAEQAPFRHTMPEGFGFKVCPEGHLKDAQLVFCLRLQQRAVVHAA